MDDFEHGRVHAELDRLISEHMLSHVGSDHTHPDLAPLDHTHPELAAEVEEAAEVAVEAAEIAVEAIEVEAADEASEASEPEPEALAFSPEPEDEVVPDRAHFLHRRIGRNS